MKTELVIGIMQTKIIDILKSQHAYNVMLIDNVSLLIMEVETLIAKYVVLRDECDGSDESKQLIKETETRLKEIGRRLDEIGNLDLMLAVYYLVSYTNSDNTYRYYLNCLWLGVGNWKI